MTIDPIRKQERGTAESVAARNQHRTTTEVAPERNGVPYEDGKKLWETYQYHARCMCGWVGPTLPTAGEARATGCVHRAEKIKDEAEWLRKENERARAMVLEDTYIPWA